MGSGPDAPPSGVSMRVGPDTSSCPKPPLGPKTPLGHKPPLGFEPPVDSMATALPKGPTAVASPEDSAAAASPEVIMPPEVSTSLAPPEVSNLVLRVPHLILKVSCLALYPRLNLGPLPPICPNTHFTLYGFRAVPS